MANRTHPSPPRFIRKAATVFVMGTELDGTDWAIIGEIQGDARLSFNQIAKRVNLSAPSVAASQ